MLHLLQTRRLLVVGRFVESTLVPVLSAETSGFGMEHGCPDVVTVVMGMAKVVDEEDEGEEGLRHTVSLTSGGQNSEMVLYKYHCLSRDKPDGGMSSGRSSLDGAHKGSINSDIDSSAASHSSLTLTAPGLDPSIVKWWYFVMFFSFRKCPENIFIQS